MTKKLSIDVDETWLANKCCSLLEMVKFGYSPLGMGSLVGHNNSFKILLE